MGEAGLSRKVVSETIWTAVEYSSRLRDLIKSIQEAEDQVRSSSQNTIDDINTTFDLLTSTVVEAFNRRRNVLISEAVKISDEGLAPLRACRDIINEKLKNTVLYIGEGKEILRIGGATSEESALHFSEQASLLGSLPAVPNLEEVPNISFQSSADALRIELECKALRLGQVSKMGPVQITGVEVKPGALLVHWEEVDVERTVDINCFRLQMAYGDVRDNSDHLESNSHDIYVGPENHHLVRNLTPGVTYTFRVCCRVEGDTDWAAWSMPMVAVTDQQPFAWEEHNQNYAVTNECKIATKASSDLATLFSKSPQFGPGHSIEFTVLECGARCSDEGLGLVAEKDDGENLVQPGALFLSTTGSVFVDGCAKTTKLPPLEKGSKVCFTCEHIRDDRIRVNIDSCNKSVTYDWNTDDRSTLNLYFAIRFGDTSWKILVE